MASTSAQGASQPPVANADLEDILRDPFGHEEPARTVVELQLIKLGGAIRDKPHWNQKIKDPTINSKWRKEFANQATNLAAVTYVMAEQEHHASGAFSGDFYPAAVPGVFAADDHIPPEVKSALMEGVQKLEAEGKPDWHPGSGDQVRDLVHPSLFPVVYGVTRQIPRAAPDLTLTNCIDAMASGSAVEGPPAGHLIKDDVSKKFQWLPAEFEVQEDGQVDILSYINNLHPRVHAPLYPVIASVFQRCVPLFNEVLTAYAGGTHLAVNPNYDWYSHLEQPKRTDFENQDEYWAAHSAWWDTRVAQDPDVPEFTPPPAAKHVVDLKGRRLQVIVKLSSIHLTPDKPEYEGGSWHLEGMLNENILATAIYYYDQQNVTPCTIAFRAAVDESSLEYEQDDRSGVQKVYGLADEEACNQELGAVTTLPDRCLCFPNNLQHKVGGFKLQDPDQPGHRKILVFWLVHPSTQVPSTARIPPQQLDWLKQEVYSYPSFWPAALPKMTLEMVEEHLEEVSSCPYSTKRAKEYRQQLMAERTYHVDKFQNEELFEREVMLCEH